MEASSPAEAKRTHPIPANGCSSRRAGRTQNRQIPRRRTPLAYSYRQSIDTKHDAADANQALNKGLADQAAPRAGSTLPFDFYGLSRCRLEQDQFIHEHQTLRIIENDSPRTADNLDSLRRQRDSTPRRRPRRIRDDRQSVYALESGLRRSLHRAINSGLADTSGL